MRSDATRCFVLAALSTRRVGLVIVVLVALEACTSGERWHACHEILIYDEHGEVTSRTWCVPSAELGYKRALS